MFLKNPRLNWLEMQFVMTDLKVCHVIVMIPFHIVLNNRGPSLAKSQGFYLRHVEQQWSYDALKYVIIQSAKKQENK